MENEQFDFEQAMKRLETIASIMDKGDATLEETLNLFEEGSRLLKQCNNVLNEAEQKITTLQWQVQSS